LFFFQAEDGIRDFHVTGVQTCALPICMPRMAPVFAVGARRNSPMRGWACGTALPMVSRLSTASPVSAVHTTVAVSAAAIQSWNRSEERRVGEEGRYGGWACHSGRRTRE